MVVLGVVHPSVLHYTIGRARVYGVLHLEGVSHGVLIIGRGCVMNS